MWAAALVAAALLLLAPRAAAAHAALLGSEPAAGDTLAAAPSRLRLRFSEPVEAAASQLVLLAVGGREIDLDVAGDPRNVAAIVAALPPLEPGGYRVQWRTISADGHPIDGTFVFFVGGPAATLAAPAATHGVSAHPHAEALPLVPALARGIAVGVLCLAAGLLAYGAWVKSGAGVSPDRAIHLLAWIVPAVLVAHAAAWAAYAGRGTPIATTLSSTSQGHVEMARVAIALLSLWALALARRRGLAAAFAMAAVLAGGWAGHSAALSPGWTIPARAAHLAALALWVGGLVILWTASARGAEAMRLAVRVSSLSLAAVVVITGSGVVQTVFFVSGIGALARSAYGAVLLVKLIGFAALVGLGAYNRFRLLPQLATDPTAPAALRRTVGVELGLMAFVFLAAGLLAYVPAPR